MKRTRIYTDVNLTKVKGPNLEWGEPNEPQWVQNQKITNYMIEDLGFTQSMMVYDGTLNRASWFIDPEHLTFHTGDGYREGAKDENNSSPPVEWAVKGCAKLASGAAHTWDDANQRWIEYYPSQLYYKKADRGLMITFDLEGHYWGSEAPHHEKVFQMAQAMHWCKQMWKGRWVNQHSRVGAYGWPWFPGRDKRQSEFQARDEVKYLMDVMDYANPCFYTVPSWETPRHWFESVDAMTVHLDRFYPHLPRIATVNPTYQIYWMDDPRFVHIKPKHNTPVPHDLWKKQIEYLIERDYEIYLWCQGTKLTETTKSMLRFLNKFQIDDARTKPLL